MIDGFQGFIIAPYKSNRKIKGLTLIYDYVSTYQDQKLDSIEAT